MKFRNMGLLISIIIAIIAGVIGYVSYYFLGADNAIEEECEKIIKDETGANIDLSSEKSSETVPSASTESAK